MCNKYHNLLFIYLNTAIDLYIVIVTKSELGNIIIPTGKRGRFTIKSDTSSRDVTT